MRAAVDSSVNKRYKAAVDVDTNNSESEFQIGCRNLLRLKRDNSASQCSDTQVKRNLAKRKRGKGRYTYKRPNPADFEALAKTEKISAQKTQEERSEEKDHRNGSGGLAGLIFSGRGLASGEKSDTHC